MKRTVEQIQHDLDHYYDHGEPESDAALDAFNSGLAKLQYELEEAKRRQN